MLPKNFKLVLRIVTEHFLENYTESLINKGNVMLQQLIQAKQESKTIEKENEKLKLVVIAAKKEVKEMKKSKKEENGEEKTDESKEDKDGTETDTEKEENVCQTLLNLIILQLIQFKQFLICISR